MRVIPEFAHNTRLQKLGGIVIFIVTIEKYLLISANVLGCPELQERTLNLNDGWSYTSVFILFYELKLLFFIFFLHRCQHSGSRYTAGVV